ncbi:elongation factor G [Sphingomonas cavernae]|uniref:Elongation factor G n=1 Tax=Sphingomonas cavernae TaxID=2320861 RepID=A0A418WM75_9SPHN|nr:elongation factor G [Sphingomonas cavernae]RJF91090.1 elongation factor G [Sphingomonas cavernae]
METMKGVRAVALVGPAGAGKTSLMEALLFAAGAISRQGAVEAGTSTGDASPEARARGGSTEINLARLEYLGDRFALIDTPGSIGFAADGDAALSAADLALIVIDPDPARASLVEPVLRRIEELGVPHAIFVNKIDQARGSIHELLAALEPMSSATLLARQIPIREGEKVKGFVDLALERAYHYRPGKESERIDIPADMADREAADRFHMLEQLADHDDDLLEQLISDQTPSLDMVCADLAREVREGLVVPVLFGSALNGFGIRRLLKMLRHEAPAPEAAAARIGATDPSSYVLKISHGSPVGRLAYARVWGAPLAEGGELIDPAGEATRIGGLFFVQGANTAKTSNADPGDVIAIAKVDSVHSGDLLGIGRKVTAPTRTASAPVMNSAVAISTQDRKDDVRLSAALHKLVEEDPSLRWGHDESAREMLLRGVNDEHLQATIAKLKRRYGVAVDTRRPSVPYRESIRKSVTQRGRHKKQSGGHGQYGDVIIEVHPLERGAGFVFNEKITGGAIPKQWIPAVELGVRDAMEHGPLGFPVVDVGVTLIDGSFHSVDSSELAFRLAGRIAMSEALPGCVPYLLEPIWQVAILTPGSATSRVSSAVSSRRGQVLGINPREGWSRWDRIDVLLPEAELHGLDAELRSLSQGLASFEARFDHLSELGGKLAEHIVQHAKASAAV